MKTRTTTQLIIDLRKIQGSKYDYDNCVYLGLNHKIIITCKIHGDFEQWPRDHLAGSGCPMCKRDKARKENKSNTADFVSKAQKFIHTLIIQKLII